MDVRVRSGEVMIYRAGDVSARETRLRNCHESVSTSAPSGDDIAFVHAILCQVGLPRSKVEGKDFLRRNGDAWINIQAGLLDEGHGPVMQEVPYGAMPRLALAWVSTYATRHKTREVPIGRSASEFLRKLGLPTTGGVRGSYGMLRRQMHALAACRIQLGFRGRTYNGQPVEQFDAWLPSSNDRQKALWPGVMLLSEAYYTDLIEHSVLLDNRALLALRGSPLRLDVYTWLAHRLHRLSGKQTLRWTSLRDQFGAEYVGKNRNKDFQRAFLGALKSVQMVYPGANVDVIKGGLLLRPSAPPVPATSRRS